MAEKISVVIPTLNEASTIPDCLDCLLSQTKKPFEVIVVDNGSKDSTRKIAAAFKSRFSKEKVGFTLLSCRRGNQTDARDLGVRKARGDIIGSLDSDACPNKDWVAKIASRFEDSRVVAIGGKSSFRNKGRIFNLLYHFNYYARLALGLYCVGGGNSAFSKSAFLAVDGYRGLEELRKAKNVHYPKDDFYLSKKLEQVGKLRFASDLNVTLLSRVRGDERTTAPSSLRAICQRVFYEITDDYKIVSYIRRDR